MKKYSTSAIAKKIGIHPNTVRFYENIGFLPKIPRKSNGYRVYNEIHLEQLKLIRTALKSEVLQNGLRKQVINIIKTSASGDYNLSLYLTQEHLKNVLQEQRNAKENIEIVKNILENINDFSEEKEYKRKELADKLGLTIDTLRNWELNGLIKIKRKSNGYRVYNERDIKRIKIISSLRCANFSLTAILRLLNKLDKDSTVKLEEIIDTPNIEDDIVSVCDRLITSLENAKIESLQILQRLKIIKKLTE